MGMRVVENAVRTIWAPMDTTSTPTLYYGQLVVVTGDGVGPAAAASGVGDTTGKQVLYGIVVGSNNRTPVYDSTHSTDKITAVITQAAQTERDWVGAEGVWVKGDPQCMVQVAVISAETVIQSPLYVTSDGTAPTLLTVTTGSTDGLGFTSNATDFTPVADLCTSYCRTGKNAGIYRISDDTSTTVETNDLAFPQDIAVGDTFVRVPVRPVGYSYVQLNATDPGLFINCALGLVTDYFIIDVLELDLRVAGKENVKFRFHPCHFDKVRA